MADIICMNDGVDLSWRSKKSKKLPTCVLAATYEGQMINPVYKAAITSTAKRTQRQHLLQSVCNIDRFSRNNV